MASQGQVIFWRYGIICICFGREEGGNCIFQTPQLYLAAARSFLETSSLQLDCNTALTSTASFIQSVRPCSCETPMCRSSAAARMEIYVLETLHNLATSGLNAIVGQGIGGPRKALCSYCRRSGYQWLEGGSAFLLLALRQLLMSLSHWRAMGKKAEAVPQQVFLLCGPGVRAGKTCKLLCASCFNEPLSFGATDQVLVNYSQKKKYRGEGHKNIYLISLSPD